MFMYCWATSVLQPCCCYLFRVEGAVMQGLIKSTFTSYKSSWSIPNGVTRLDVGPVSDDTSNGHHYSKKQ